MEIRTIAKILFLFFIFLGCSIYLISSSVPVSVTSTNNTEYSLLDGFSIVELFKTVNLIFWNSVTRLFDCDSVNSEMDNFTVLLFEISFYINFSNQSLKIYHHYILYCLKIFDEYYWVKNL